MFTNEFISLCKEFAGKREDVLDEIVDAEISIADILYTSGLGSTYKGAIPVGKIIEVVNDKNDINRYAIVEPNVNIRTISEVGVIIN